MTTKDELAEKLRIALQKLDDLYVQVGNVQYEIGMLLNSLIRVKYSIEHELNDEA